MTRDFNPQHIGEPDEENILNLGLLQLKSHEGSLQILGGIPFLAQGGLSVGHFTGGVVKLGDGPAALNTSGGVRFEEHAIRPNAELNLLNAIGGQAGVDLHGGRSVGINPYAQGFVGPLNAGGVAGVNANERGMHFHAHGGVDVSTRDAAIVGANGGGSIALGANSRIGADANAYVGDINVGTGAYIKTHGDRTIDPNVYLAGSVAGHSGRLDLNPPPARRMEEPGAQQNRIEVRELKEPYTAENWNRYYSNAMSYYLDSTSIVAGKNDHTWLDIAKRVAAGADQATIKAEAHRLAELNRPEHVHPGLKILTMSANAADPLARRAANEHFGLKQQ